jgi:hypothetical protein
MIRVFIAQHPVEAHFIKGLLEANDIEAEVRGEALFGGLGELPITTDCLPSVWLRDDREREKALAIIAAFEHRGGVTLAGDRSWSCRECGEEIDPQFTACWRCGVTRPPES